MSDPTLAPAYVRMVEYYASILTPLDTITERMASMCEGILIAMTFPAWAREFLAHCPPESLASCAQTAGFLVRDFPIDEVR